MDFNFHRNLIRGGLDLRLGMFLALVFTDKKVKILLFALLLCVPAFGQQAHYRADGPSILNDLHFTPGAKSGATATELCSPSFRTVSVRNVSESTKKAAYREYGVAEKKGICCEVDHLISLELGGSNDIKNLWPQPYSPRPGAHEKDVVENELHRQVCGGEISLSQAQKEIATNWYTVYLSLNKSK